MADNVADDKVNDGQPADGDMADLLARCRKGDQAAADAIFHRYVNRLVAFARTRLSAKLAQRVDPEDVVQSVYRSFFTRARDGQYTLDRNGDLWRLLATITINKLHKQVEFHSAQKRSFDREQSLSAEDSLGNFPAEQLAREPSPADATAAVEELQLVMESLSPLQRQMLELYLQGNDIAEVAEAVQRSERAVRRLLALVKQQLADRAALVAAQ
ncbi:MAG: sigma-70 family RNA polymerase sigma factor [Pirellulales bacterium]